MSGAGAIACIGGGGFLVDDERGVQERHLLTLIPESRRRERPRVVFLGADKPGVTANVRLPGDEAREVAALDLSSR
jgi:hypothetical protein